MSGDGTHSVSSFLGELPPMKGVENMWNVIPSSAKRAARKVRDASIAQKDPAHVAIRRARNAARSVLLQGLWPYDRAADAAARIVASL